MNGFFSELTKIAEEEAAADPQAAAPLLGVPAAELARMLGEAQAYQGMPHLRHALDTGARWGGIGGASVSVAQRRPGMAALMTGLVDAPGLIKEIESGVRGYRGLKESGLLNEQALAEVRNTLLKRGIGRVIPAGMHVALNALVAKGHDIPTSVRTLLPAFTGMALSGLTGGTLKGPALSMEDAEKLRQEMGVEAPLHHGLGNQFGKYVAPESTSVLAPGLQSWWNATRLKSGSKPEARKMLEEGGVIVPVSKARKARL